MKAQFLKNENLCLENLECLYFGIVCQALLFFHGNEWYNYRQLSIVIITNSSH